MYAKIFHVSIKDLRICAKNPIMIIIKSSNNPIVDVLRPAQKLQVWNTYIPGFQHDHRADCPLDWFSPFNSLSAY